MRILVLIVLLASTSFAEGWDSVQRLSAGQKVEVKEALGTARGVFVSATESAIVVRTRAGEQSISKANVEVIRVADPTRRMRNGLIATAIGAGAGFGAGLAICPHCGNEGAGAKYTGPMTALGAGVGAAAGFLPTPYRTIYRVK